MRTIVLSSVRFNDSGKVVRFFTEDHGLRAYAVMGLGSGNKGKAALFQPLSLLDADEEMVRSGRMGKLTSARRSYIFQSLPTNALKSATAFFCAEVLERALAENQANPELFEFCWNAIQWLDLDEDISLFPIFWALNIIRYTGVFPDVRGEGAFFDLSAAKWTNNIPVHRDFLEQTDARLWFSLLTHKATQEREEMLNRNQRKHLLEATVVYLQHHTIGSANVKSYEVLKEVFS